MMLEQFKRIEDPPASTIPAEPKEFLKQLAGPTEIWLTGRQPERTRAIVTLLHGNEPSGFLAVHRLLCEEVRPQTNLLILLVSVEAALLDPGFRYRAYPGERDINRSFNPPYRDSSGRIARQILERIELSRAEAVLDIHNTSGKSPSFAVSTEEDWRHEVLAAMFTERLVITELQMGSLMEQSSAERPIITIECGGAQEAPSHQLAWQGVRRFISSTELFAAQPEFDLDIYHDPVRLELEQGLKLAFSDEPVLGVDLTLLAQVDQYNFTLVPPGTLLGWIRDSSVIERLRVIDARGTNRREQFFEFSGNRVQTKAPQKLFMVTTRPDIALSDCLLYSAFESEHERVHISSEKHN